MGKADPPMIDSAKIQPGQILANNGVIHVIDAVIIPDSVDLTDIDHSDHAHGSDTSKPMTTAPTTAAPTTSAAATASFTGVLALLFGASFMINQLSSIVWAHAAMRKISQQ